jgi:hypothetical protein
LALDKYSPEQEKVNCLVGVGDKFLRRMIKEPKGLFFVVKTLDLYIEYQYTMIN